MSDNPETQEKNKKDTSGFVKLLSEPLSKYGLPPWLVYILSIIGGIYILNPSFGVLEFIPDNLPIIGNLDEGAAVMLILAGIVELLEGRKQKNPQNAGKTGKSIQAVSESDSNGKNRLNSGERSKN